jgi:hypothetical protein
MKYDELLTFIRETLTEANRTQDRRLRTFTNSITKSIMAIYSNRKPELSYSEISLEDISVTPTTASGKLYEIEAGVFPLAFDPESIDSDFYEEGEEIDPFLTVVLEIDKNAPDFNVSATDKSITGMSDLGIHIAIQTPPEFAKQDMGMLRDEIANSVRHELEHVTQGEESDQPASAYGRDEKYYTFLYGPSDVSSSHAKYLLKHAEIPAHIRGYTQNAKTIEEFEEDIDSLLAGYVTKRLISASEQETIRSTWLDWVRNNINRKGF